MWRGQGSEHTPPARLCLLIPTFLHMTSQKRRPTPCDAEIQAARQHRSVTTGAVTSEGIEQGRKTVIGGQYTRVVVLCPFPASHTCTRPEHTLEIESAGYWHAFFHAIRYVYAGLCAVRGPALCVESWPDLDLREGVQDGALSLDVCVEDTDNVLKLPLLLQSRQVGRRQIEPAREHGGAAALTLTKSGISPAMTAAI
jgi:hypothetical protein